VTKQDHINYWKDTSFKDWKAVQDLFATKNYVQSLFLAHLTIEKLIKAIWVKDNTDNVPPRTHDLVRLISYTLLRPSEDALEFLESFNDFQLEGRYPDYQLQLYKACDLDFTKPTLDKINDIRQWLISNLQ